ncbi:MAG TPA: phosphatidate cytidylyltransferase [Anaerolineaceae bacterium]
MAALVPFAITVQFILVGKGLMKDQSAIDSMSRTGNPAEILRGPLYYGIMFVLLTVIFWKDSPVGIIALMLLCGGDGLADIIGRRVKSHKLPWSERKTILGSVSVFIGGWIMAVGVLLVYIASGVFPFSIAILSWKVALIALAGALVESLPFRDIDNITVPIVAVILGYLLFI